MTTLEVLKKAYHLLDSEERWTQHAQARTKEGRSVDAHHSEAVQWCAIGAIFHVSPDLHSDVWAEDGPLWALIRGLEEQCAHGIVRINNGPGGYERIREGFRAAIAKLEPPLVRGETPECELANVP